LQRGHPLLIRHRGEHDIQTCYDYLERVSQHPEAVLANLMPMMDIAAQQETIYDKPFHFWFNKDDAPLGAEVPVGHSYHILGLIILAAGIPIMPALKEAILKSLNCSRWGIHPLSGPSFAPESRFATNSLRGKHLESFYDLVEQYDCNGGQGIIYQPETFAASALRLAGHLYYDPTGQLVRASQPCSPSCPCCSIAPRLLANGAVRRWTMPLEQLLQIQRQYDATFGNSMSFQAPSRSFLEAVAAAMDAGTFIVIDFLPEGMEVPNASS